MRKQVLGRSRRRGFTLVEMLVVVAIIGILATLGLMFYPAVSDKQRVLTAVDQVSGQMLNAKMMAKRDGIPTGVRFLMNGSTSSEMVYVQQPDPYAVGRITDISGSTLTFTGVNFQDLNQATGSTSNAQETFLVADGDYIEIFGGPIRKINKITSPSTLTVLAPTTPLPALTGVSSDTSQPNYRILPGPRVVGGEQSVKLATNLGVDFTPPAAGNQVRSNLNARLGVYYELLFSPSGSVLGQTNTDGQVFLWVADLKLNTPQAAAIVAINLRTGFIATHPVAVNHPDLFFFTRDGRNSGM